MSAAEANERLRGAPIAQRVRPRHSPPGLTLISHAEAGLGRWGLRCGRAWFVAVVGMSLAIAHPAALCQEEAPADEREPVEVPKGLKLEQEFGDFLHFVVLGRFAYGQAYGEHLLKRDDLEPVRLLELADKYANSREALIRVFANPIVGPTAQRVHEVIRQGELIRRKDPQLIKRHIEGLMGPPRAEWLNTVRLGESGEYAAPWLVRTLEDPSKPNLHTRIVRALPKIGKPLVNPFVIALRAENAAMQQTLMKALGQIGYPQALPYLKQVAENPKASSDVKKAAEDAIAMIEEGQSETAKMSAAELFLDLAEQYYDDRGSVRADLREAIANVWYWRDGGLTRVEVPREIFNEIMCMRCCEEALKLGTSGAEGARPETEDAVEEVQPSGDAPELGQAVPTASSTMAGATALWLASNFRRETQLGMDPASEQADERAANDKTRPENFPRSIYFARAAGPLYNHMVLARAVRDGEPGVALGAIAALTETAGPTSLVGAEDYKQPLVEGLGFPNLLVRIKAAVALGQALPRSKFSGSRNVIPVLAEALAQTGQRRAIVVDPDEQNRNRVQGELRAEGIAVIGEPGFFAALNRARKEVAAVDVIFVATDIKGPELAPSLGELREDFAFAATPVVLLAKPQQMALAEQFALADVRVGRVLASAGKEDLLVGWQQVAEVIGAKALDEEEALRLALAAAETLRLIAVSNSPVYDFARAQTALIDALAHPAEELRIKAASVLALASSPQAQHAVAKVALNAENSQTLRIAAFGSLAESAKHNGNRLTNELIDELIKFSMKEENLELRTAASRALGAMNLPSNKASEIVRSYYRG